jgi:hypothetical protein
MPGVEKQQAGATRRELTARLWLAPSDIGLTRAAAASSYAAVDPVLDLIASMIASSGGTADRDLDWRLLAAFPSATLALIGFLAYWVGLLRPVKIVHATYWRLPNSTSARFKCVIRNRSPLWDRTLSGLVFAETPKLDWLFRLRRIDPALALPASGEMLNSQVV